MKKWMMKNVWKYVMMSLVLIWCWGTTANAETLKWKSTDRQWYAGGYVYYMSGNTLYKSPNQSNSQGIKDKVASWNIKESKYLTIVHGYKNKLYISCTDEYNSEADLYSVNVKTGKKKKEVSNCCVVAAKGKYVYGNVIKVTDTGAYPVYLWKITGKSVKKVKMLGKYIFGTTIVNNKVYYASYPSKSQKKMTVYSCKLDGSKRKKLFTLEGKGEYCQVLINDVNEKTITAYVSSGENQGLYEYNIKTGKLKKK